MPNFVPKKFYHELSFDCHLNLGQTTIKKWKKNIYYTRNEKKNKAIRDLTHFKRYPRLSPFFETLRKESKQNKTLPQFLAIV